jgi:hypothetical protein
MEEKRNAYRVLIWISEGPFGKRNHHHVLEGLGMFPVP